MTTGALADSAFQSAFWSAKYSVFRLEADRPLVGDPNLERWQRGQPWVQTASKDEWMRLVARRRDDGVSMERVKVVAEPWTPPAAFLLTQSFPFNVVAGEQIGVIGIGPDRAMPTAAIPRGGDFWLFDEAALWWLDYAEDGELTAVRRVADAASLLHARRARTAALAASTRLHTYLAEQGIRQTA